MPGWPPWAFGRMLTTSPEPTNAPMPPTPSTTALVFLTKTNFSRLWWGASWTLVAILVPTVRYTVKQLLMSKGAWLRKTVIIGVGPNAVDTALALESEPLLGYEVVAFVQPANKDAEAPGSIEIGMGFGRWNTIPTDLRSSRTLTSSS